MSKLLFEQSDNVFNSPKLLSNFCFHCWSASEGFVNPAEVVMHVVKSDSMHMILNLLVKAVRESGESPHTHSHGKVLALNIGR